jgi:hypothetical protein
MMNKAELLNWLQEEYQNWQALLDQIGPARMEQPGVNGDWTMKDLVAHMAYWQPRLTTRILAAQRGEPQPPPPWPAHLQTEDEVNAWIYETHRDRPVREVLEDTKQIFQQFLTVIEGLPDDVRVDVIRHNDRTYYLLWLGETRFPAGEFFDHFHDDHEPDVRAWLARVEQAR